MKKTLIILSMLLGICTGRAQKSFIPHTWGDWQTWGDQHDGHYLNPVIPADYSDIDCIEHDGFYYAISSTFQFEPGMVILRSTDMVNWHVYSHAVPDVSQITDGKGSGKAMTWQGMDRYAKGIWAGAIRWHKGRFYVYFGCPDEGMFMTTAKKIEGPWAPLTKMKAEGHDGVNFKGGWDDCCPLFEAPSPALLQRGSYDVKKYPYFFVATHYADGYKTYVFPLSADGKTVDWDHKVLINEGYGREASKLYKWTVDIDGQKVTKYYHMFSEDRDGGRYLVMQRADHPMGPYNERHRLHYTEREWNEPNQGGYLKDAAGNWFFLTHHGHGDWGGREASLLPVTWTKNTGNPAEDGWPIIGEPDKDNVGKMVWRHKMPVAKRSEKLSAAPAKSPETGINSQFSISSFLASDWEWNYHPRKGYFTRTEKALTLKAFKPLRENDLMKAGNTLTMRSYQTPVNSAEVTLDLSRMAEGQRSGICHFSSAWSEFGVKMERGKRLLYYRDNTGKEKVFEDQELSDRIKLKSEWGLDAKCTYHVGDGKFWKECATYYLQWGNYRGDRLGLYTYNNLSESGEATFTNFNYVTNDDESYHSRFGLPILPDMIADASIQMIGDTFYCYATTDGYGRGLDTSGPAVVWKSKDFVHWSFDGGILPQMESEKFWAPSKAIYAPHIISPSGKQGAWFLYPTINGYMYPLVADSPDGPFTLAKGNSLTVQNRLWEKDNVHAIDAEIFVDDVLDADGQPLRYAFWGSRHVVRLKPDMVTIDTSFTPAPSTGLKQEAPGVYTIPTRRTEYSEGPIVFKRNGIYYYLYTIGGDERYEYYYQMSRVSPLGPWETPKNDLVCTSNVEWGTFGPGHGCVFSVPARDEDDEERFYLAYLEFGRRSTNRMTYACPLVFNDDGTIKQANVDILVGTGYLRDNDHPRKLRTFHTEASSEAPRHLIRENQDWRCRRTESFSPGFATDFSYSSRWMAADDDVRPTLTRSFSEPVYIGSSEIAFVRPTAGHAYILEGSLDGETWTRIGGHADVQKRSPHVDKINASFRYLRLTITAGEKGVYEWNVYE